MPASELRDAGLCGQEEAHEARRVSSRDGGGGAVISAGSSDRAALSEGGPQGGRRAFPIAVMLRILPAPDAGLRLAGPAHDLVGANSAREDDRRPPSVFLRGVTVPGDRFKSAADGPRGGGLLRGGVKGGLALARSSGRAQFL